MNTNFEYQFPAIKGIQAGREYYTSMCPLKLIPKLFRFDDEELLPELRAQRILNTTRVPKLADYITENPDDYVFSAITASIDGKVEFSAYESKGLNSRIGTLNIDMNSRLIINDGQHRRAAIGQALKKAPTLGEESIAVVFFVDRGLERCQQMFADLNRHAQKPSKSLGLLYDHRDDEAKISRGLVFKSRYFGDLVELERSSLSQRSRKLFTLSAIHYANSLLLKNQQFEDIDSAINTSVSFWDSVGDNILEWQMVQASRLTSGEVRKDFIHSHSVTLQAIGNVGDAILKLPEARRGKVMKKLAKIDWRRLNDKSWEGRAMVGGKMKNALDNVALTGNLIKTSIGINLTPEEAKMEAAMGSYNG